MPTFGGGGAGSSTLGFKPKNKERRQAAYVRHKKNKEAARRDMRMKRRRDEDKNPDLRAARQARNKPHTIERKRVWDTLEDDAEGDGLGLSVDMAALKRRRLDRESLPGGGLDGSKTGLTEHKLKQVEEQAAAEDADGTAGLEAHPRKGKQRAAAATADGEDGSEDDEDDEADEEEDDDPQDPDQDDDADDADADSLASILNDTDSNPDDGDAPTSPPANRKASPPASTTSTALTQIPDALAAKFPTLFTTPAPSPKVLITTSLGGTVHREAEQLTSLIPNSTYIRRQRHRYQAHHFALREIAKFAANRHFTALLVLEEEQKRPAGLVVMHLPAGPTLHFSVRNWVAGAALPGHGNATAHAPELVVNGFRTPLGALAAQALARLFPPTPALAGRQVVALQCARDFIFVRRHRYVFRARRAGEKAVAASADDERTPMPGLEGVRAGLQELGPRFTLKLRRVDRGIQRASGEEWAWRARMEKLRTRFQL